MPTSNSNNSIKLPLNSLQAQTFQNFELIVIDKDSEDKTVSTVKHFFPFAEVINQNGSGIWDAINLGIKKSRFEIVHVLNSDDFISPGALNAALTEFEKNPNLFALWLPTYSAGGFRNSLNNKKLFMGMHTFCPGHSASFFVKKSAHSFLGYYDNETKFCADHEFFWKLLRAQMLVKVLESDTDFGVFCFGGFSSTNPYIKKVREEAGFRRPNAFHDFDDFIFCFLVRPLKELWSIFKRFKI